MLGPRLLACCSALDGLPTTDAEDVLGAVDAQKLHSSMTLFAHAAPQVPVFRRLLDRWFGGAEDAGTTSRMGPLGGD